MDAEIDRLLAWWGRHANPAVGLPEAPARAFAGARRAVEEAVRLHGQATVLDGFRALVAAPEHEGLRAKVRARQAGFFGPGWACKRISEYAMHHQATLATPASPAVRRSPGQRLWEMLAELGLAIVLPDIFELAPIENGLDDSQWSILDDLVREGVPDEVREAPTLEDVLGRTLGGAWA